MLFLGPALGRGALAGLPSLGWAELADPAPAPDDQTARCRELWQTVLLVLLVDAARPLASRSRSSARNWLINGSRDRALVLDLAGIDADVFVSRGLPHLQAAWAAADAAPECTPRMARPVDAAERARRSARMVEYHRARAGQPAAAA